MKTIILLSVILTALTFQLSATTWYPAEHTCPICNHKDEYQEIGSYGKYIYQWPSKFQYVFWPLTDMPSVYCCSKCHFTTFMFDFENIPKDKIETIAEFLKTVKLEKRYKEYVDIPMTTRLEIAENIYKILGRDTEFWCKFYRVLGYHYELEKNIKKAEESRLKSIDLARHMLTDSLYKGQEKETFFIIAAMQNYTGQKDSALFYLDKAGSLSYQNKNWNEENISCLDKYLSELAEEYKAAIRKEEDGNTEGNEEIN